MIHNSYTIHYTTDAFNKAIESEEAKEEPIDITTILVDSNYTGPRIQNDDITTLDDSFIRITINHLKEQKKIHRKYVIMILLAIKVRLKNTPTLVRIQLDTPLPTPTTTSIEMSSNETATDLNTPNLSVCNVPSKKITVCGECTV